MGQEFKANGRLTALSGWVVVPVPLHKRKRRQRGFNQSEMLARGWSDATGMPVLNALVRPRSGGSLTRLGRHERIRDTAGRYIPNPRLESGWSLAVQGCLLLDDVITTGSTLTACHQALTPIWSGPMGFLTMLDAAA